MMVVVVVVVVVVELTTSHKEPKGLAVLKTLTMRSVNLLRVVIRYRDDPCENAFCPRGFRHVSSQEGFTS